MFSYIAYGLGIRSAFPLPELEAGGAPVALTIRFGAVDRPVAEAVTSGAVLSAGAEVRFFWKEAGAFAVRDGREIVVDPVPRADERLLRLYITGPVLAALLRQRGFLVLHATTVTMDGGARVFLGAPRQGKSTLAAILYARGHGVLADDVTAVRVEEHGVTVLPGIPRLKLWPDAAAALGLALDELPRIHPSLEKRAVRAERGFAAVPLPLTRAYVLASGEQHDLEPLRPQEALVELIRHSYGASLLRLAEPAFHFRQCAAVAGRIRLFRLRVQRELSALSALASLVEEDREPALA